MAKDDVIIYTGYMKKQPRYVGKEAPNLLLEEELEKSDSEGRIRAKLAGSCLTAAVYFIVYFTVLSVRAPAYRNRHGGVRSAAVAEAIISRESKVDSNVLEWFLHLMSDKTKKQ